MLDFADDTLVVVVGDTTVNLEISTNNVLKTVADKITQIGLSLAVNKTEAVLFTYKYKYTPPRLELDGQQLALRKQLTYLRIIFDQSL